MSVQCNPFGPLGLASRLAFPDVEAESPRPKAQEYFQYATLSGRATTAVVLDLSSPFVTPVDARQLAAQFYGLVQPTYMLNVHIVPPSFGLVEHIFSEIENLSSDNEVPPTEFAFLKSRSVVGAAYGMMLPKQHSAAAFPSLPAPVVLTDDVGGIRFSWRKGNKTVRANIGANENLRSYIYYESNTEHGVTPLDGGSLSDRLNWLIKA